MVPGGIFFSEISNKLGDRFDQMRDYIYILHAQRRAC